MEELTAVSPADGLVGGLAEVWGQPAVLAAYDFTVFAGTQGAMNHKKQDRLFSLAAERSLPVVLFAETNPIRVRSSKRSTLPIALSRI